MTEHKIQMSKPENQKTYFRRVINPGVKLALLIGILVFLVTLIHQTTRDTIAAEKKRVTEKLLYEIAGTDSVDLSRVAPDHYLTTDPLNNQGHLFKAITQEGYNDEIELWIGIDNRGAISGVRIIEHRETPGLGDKITLDVSDWILGFNGKSLTNPASEYWKVKKDGGQFDQFTGATITPRAIVAAVHKTLIHSANLQSNEDQNP